MGRECPHPQPTGGLGSIVSSPSAVFGAYSRPKTGFGAFGARKNTSYSDKFDMFAAHKGYLVTFTFTITKS